MSKNKKKSTYIAFDSDVLSDLALIHNLKTQDKDFEISTFHDKYLADNARRFKVIYDKIKSGEIKPIVLSTVFNETSFVPIIMDFIKEFGYFPKTDKHNKKKQLQEIKQLAKSYVKPYENEGRVYTPPMKELYSAFAGGFVPSNDAFIMAEATYHGYLLVTANEKDYIYTDAGMERRKQKLNATKTRMIGICNINKENGYTMKDNSEFSTPIPISFIDFATRVARNNLTNLNGGKSSVKVSDVMGE